MEALSLPMKSPNRKFVVDFRKYPCEGLDPDTMMFLGHFVRDDISRESHILEIGANDEFAANVLTDNGYRVLGVDLLPHYRPTYTNYFRIRGDFNLLAASSLPMFDVVFSISTIEHFGLGGCGPGDIVLDLTYDQIAMHNIWRILNPGGRVYLTMPYGKDFIICGREWRSYNKETLRKRIVGMFKVDRKEFFVAGDIDRSSIRINPDNTVDEQEADRYPVGMEKPNLPNWKIHPPHLVVCLVLVKEVA